MLWEYKDVYELSNERKNIIHQIIDELRILNETNDLSLNSDLELCFIEIKKINNKITNILVK